MNKKIFCTRKTKVSFCIKVIFLFVNKEAFFFLQICIDTMLAYILLYDLLTVQFA
jgi:hypothetical protein